MKEPYRLFVLGPVGTGKVMLPGVLPMIFLNEK